jgi:hypothetical protein
MSLSVRVPLQGDKWRPAEDSMLMELVGKELSWKEISDELPGRSEISCIQHYHRSLSKRIQRPDTDKIVRLYNQYDLSRSYYLNIANTSC